MSKPTPKTSPVMATRKPVTDHAGVRSVGSHPTRQPANIAEPKMGAETDGRGSAPGALGPTDEGEWTETTARRD